MIERGKPMAHRSDPVWDSDGLEYEKTEILKNNNKMLENIIGGMMKNPWNAPTPEDLSYISSASIESQIDALIDELSKRDMKLARTYLKTTMLRLCGETSNAEPFLPIAHRS